MAGSANDKGKGPGRRKASPVSGDILGAGWESRLEEARARRAKALEGKGQPEPAEAPKPWEARAVDELPPLIDEVTGKETDAPDLSLLGLEAKDEPGLPPPPSEAEVEAAIAAARAKRIKTQERLDVNDAEKVNGVASPVRAKTRKPKPTAKPEPEVPTPLMRPSAEPKISVVPAPDPAVSPLPAVHRHENDLEKALASPPAAFKPLQSVEQAVENLRPVRRQSWAERQKEAEAENEAALHDYCGSRHPDEDDDATAGNGIRWGLVAAASLLIAAPILGYGYLMRDDGASGALQSRWTGLSSTARSLPPGALAQPKPLERIEITLADPSVPSDSLLSTAFVPIILPNADFSVPNAPGWPSLETAPAIAELYMPARPRPKPRDLLVALSQAQESPRTSDNASVLEQSALWAELTSAEALKSDVRLAFGFSRGAEPPQIPSRDVLSEVAPRAETKVGRLSVLASLGVVAPPEAPDALDAPLSGSVEQALAIKGPTTDGLPTLPARLERAPSTGDDAIVDGFERGGLDDEQDLTLVSRATDDIVPQPPRVGADRTAPGLPNRTASLIAPGTQVARLLSFVPVSPVLAVDAAPTRPDPSGASGQAVVLAMLAPAPALPAPSAPNEQLVPVLSGPGVEVAPPAPAAVAADPIVLSLVEPVAPTDEAIGGAVVYLHAAATSDPAELETALALVAAETGYPTKTTPPFDFKISQTQVRYFHEADRAAAEVVANAMSARLRSFLSFNPKPDPGTVELWLAGGGKSGAPAAAPKVVQKRPSQTVRKPVAPKRQAQSVAPQTKIEATTIIRKRQSTLGRIFGGSGG